MSEFAVTASPSSTASPLPSNGSIADPASSATAAAAAVALPLLAVVGGFAAMLVLEFVFVLIATHGHFVYPLEAAYTHLTLAKQIALGHYGLEPGEAAAPSSSILYPFLLAALRPLGAGVLLPLAINALSTLGAGALAVLLAAECGIPLHRVPPLFLAVLAAVVALALDLPGLAMTGLEHSFHIAMTVAYLLGLVRFVKRGRCDWWWFACIIIQPIVRFEAAGMLVADALIFVAFRKYGYALAMVVIGVILVGGYSLFLHSLGLPLLPSSVLARSDWSNAATVSHSGPLSVVAAILKNLYSNLNSFGAAQMLGGVALGLAWVGFSREAVARRPLDTATRINLVTLGFMTFVTVAQIAGGKLGWKPARYEAYVLVLNLCGVAVIFRERIAVWCERASWRGVAFVGGGVLLVFAGYASQFVLIPQLAAKEYQGGFQLHRFVTEFYRAPVAVDQIGYVNYANPFYVLDLSGLGSEAARQQRAAARTPEWMDGLLASHDVGLAIIDKAIDPVVPAAWVKVGELRAGGGLSDEGPQGYVFYARRSGDVAPAADALARFVPTLPGGVAFRRADPAGDGAG